MLCGGHSSSCGLITRAPSTTSLLVSWPRDSHLSHLSCKPPQTPLLKCSFHPRFLPRLQPSLHPPPSLSPQILPSQSFKTQGNLPSGQPLLTDIILRTPIPFTPSISTTPLASCLYPIIYCFLTLHPQSWSCLDPIV